MKRVYAAVSGLVIFTAILILIIVVKSTAVGESKTAEIYKEGKLISEINLDELTAPTEFTIEGEDGSFNVIRAENGRIRMTDADCPDKTCVKQGWAKSGLIPIVCLPNKVTVEITGADTDARTGGAQ